MENMIKCVVLYLIFFVYHFSVTSGHSLKMMKTSVTPVTIVVAHCKESLEWLSSEIEELSRDYPQYVVREVKIYSKCGRRVLHAPARSTIERLPNVGRCDHTYLHFLSHMTVLDGVVLFMKDTRHVYWKFEGNSTKAVNTGLASVRSYGEMIKLALSPTQFCCRQYINAEKTGVANAVITKLLLSWTRDAYVEGIQSYTMDYRDESPFSKYSNMLQWVKDVNVSISRPLTSVCYGGVFAAPVKRLLEIGKHVWNRLRISLSRGNNIQEGHFMERAWYLENIVNLCDFVIYGVFTGLE